MPRIDSYSWLSENMKPFMERYLKTDNQKMLQLLLDCYHQFKCGDKSLDEIKQSQAFRTLEQWMWANAKV